MPSPFAITAASNSVSLDAKRHAEAPFTVFNSSGRPIRGRARLEPENAEAAGWLSLAGVAERDFSIAGTEQYTAHIAVPRDAPSGSYGFRLDMVGVENPDEMFTQGPTITFEVSETEPAKLFPWWAIIAAVAGLTLCCGLAIGGYFVYQNLPSEEEPTPTTETTNTPQPTRTPQPSSTPTEAPPTLSPPTNLQAAIQADDTMLFTWDDAEGEVEYQYTFSFVAGGLGAATLDTLLADTTSWNGGGVGCSGSGNFTLVAIAEDASEIGQATVDFETPPCPPETVILLPVNSLSGRISPEGCSGDPIWAGIAPAGNSMRALVSFDITDLNFSFSIIEATLDLSDYTTSGDPFEFLHPLHIEQVEFGNRCDYPHTFSGPTVTTLAQASAAVPGVTNPIDVTAELSDYLASADPEYFQIRLRFEGDSAGSAFASKIQWPTIRLIIEHRP